MLAEKPVGANPRKIRDSSQLRTPHHCRELPGSGEWGWRRSRPSKRQRPPDAQASALGLPYPGLSAQAVHIGRDGEILASAACSGAMYLGVPRIWPGSVNDGSASVSRFARPKSVTKRVPWGSTSTFEGFRSRCKTPRWWAWCTARATGDQAGDLRARSACRGASPARCLRRTSSSSTAGRRARRPRRSARCAGGRGSPPPRPRRGTAATSFSVANVPRRIIFSATIRFERDLPRLVDDAHPAAGDLLSSS